MKFKYKAKTKEGAEQTGFVDGADKDGVMAILNNHGLYILSIEEADREKWYDRISSYLGRVKRKELVIFTRQLAVLMEAQLPLMTVIKTLEKQTEQPRLKEAILQIREDVDAGLAFSQAIERQKNIFPGYFVSMIRSAEVTGNLDKVVGFLADYLEKEAVLASKVKSAMIYPVIVIGLFAAVVLIMLTFVFPQLVPVFEQSGVALPLFTRIMLGSGKFITKWWIVIALLFTVITIVVLDYLRTPEGVALTDEMKIHLPIVKKIYIPLTLTRFASTSSMLLKGGVPITQAIEIVAQTIDNVVYRDVLRKISEGVSQGEHLAEALGKAPAYFPTLVSQMISVGETTGRVDQMLTRVGEFYMRETDTLVGNLVDLIQPVLMVGIGIMVAILFASILLPLYQLTSSIQ
ncbi:MAG: type II secretion system F family protein [Candidatus Liptonbacteria bacterium]|nr:type II secretion system F family protein [Candidatus Liptonbacteria bacterium]